MSKIVISTVGTSLFHSNIRNLPDFAANGDIGILERVKERKEFLEAKNFIALARSLEKENETKRQVGAEINSLAQLMIEKIISPNDKLLFLVSDTEDGQGTGEVLCRYYNSKYKKDMSGYRVVEGLDDKNPKHFKTIGLRNLIKEISVEVRKYGGANTIINATGGYKAQVLFAGVMGQSLGIPVYYLFERFSEIIELPPQPISLDSELWLDYQDIFMALSGATGVESDIAGISWDSKFDTLIEREKVDDEILVSLSPTGEIFHQTFYYRYAQQFLQSAELRPCTKKKKPHLGNDHHRPKGLLEYLEKLTSEFDFIVQCKSYELKNRTSPNNYFHINMDFHGQRKEIFGSYSSDFKSVFLVYTTAEDEIQQEKAKLILNEWANKEK